MAEPLQAESKSLFILSGDNGGIEQERWLYVLPVRCRLRRLLLSSETLVGETIDVISSRGTIATGHAIAPAVVDETIVLEVDDLTAYDGTNNIFEEGDFLIIEVTTGLTGDWTFTPVFDRVA